MWDKLNLSDGKSPSERGGMKAPPNIYHNLYKLLHHIYYYMSDTTIRLPVELRNRIKNLARKDRRNMIQWLTIIVEEKEKTGHASR